MSRENKLKIRHYNFTKLEIYIKKLIRLRIILETPKTHRFQSKTDYNVNYNEKI